MTDSPENADLNWLAQHLIEFRNETRTELRSFGGGLSGVRDEIQGLREQIGVAIAGLLRVERNLTRVRQDIRALFGADRDYEEARK